VGLTFLNAAFLFGALMALVPLVIHLISRRRMETVDFSSLMFLQELERKRIRRVRLRQILLLIVRSLILLAAALALARPTLTGAFATGVTAHARTSAVIVLDDSASMNRDGGGTSPFERAKETAREILGLLREGDEVFLVASSRPARSVVEGGTFSLDAMREALDELEPGARATDSVGAVDLALELAAGSANLNREIYVIGDLQRTGWGGAAEPGGPRTSAEGVRVYVLPVSGARTNIAVAGVAASRTYGGTRGLHSITAEIRSFAEGDHEIPVRLFVDDVQVGQTGVGVPGGGAAVARFATVLDPSDWHRGRVEIPSDAMAVDNEAHFVVPRPRGVEVLVVQPEGAESADDGYYVSRALDPTGLGESFRVSRVGSDELESQEPGRFPVVVLADAGRIGDGGEAWLERHVEGGGGMLAVLGGRTDVRRWESGAMAGLTGVGIREPFERPRAVRFAPSGHGHPILKGLVVGDRLVDDVGARRGFTAEIPEGSQVLEFPGVGGALVMTEASSGGRTAVLLTGVDPAWSDLPKSGFLVPLLHRVVSELAEGDTAVRPVSVGGDLAVPLRTSDLGRVDVELPDGETATAGIRTAPRPAAVWENAESPGVYSFRAGGRVVGLGAVNVAPEESDLRSIGRAEAERLLSPVPVRWIDDAGSIEGTILESRRGRELWRVFVYGALALLGLEMLLARPRRSAAPEAP